MNEVKRYQMQRVACASPQSNSSEESTPAKGTKENPYTESEFIEMLNNGTWQGGYVGNQYYMKELTVIASASEGYSNEDEDLSLSLSDLEHLSDDSYPTDEENGNIGGGIGGGNSTNTGNVGGSNSGTGNSGSNTSGNKDKKFYSDVKESDLEKIMDTQRMCEYFCIHPLIAWEVGADYTDRDNITNNSRRFANNLFRKGEYNYNNGFQHLLWQATITSKYGIDVAKQIGDVHEHIPNFDTSYRRFEGDAKSEYSDMVKDLLNNEIGRAIGLRCVEMQMHEIALQILKHMYEEGFYLVCGENDDSCHVIEYHKITYSLYFRCLERLEKLDKNGSIK